MSKIRLIQCGVGGMGGNWSGPASKSPDFDLVAIVDINQEALDKTGEAVGIPPERRFKSLEAALAAVKADAIVTVTPPAIHAPHTRLAMEAGLHVLTEKPLADNLDNARDMVRLAAKTGKQLLVAQNYRYRPCTQKLKQLMVDKPLGEFGHGHIDFYIPADFTGTFRETMEFPLLVDMAIHHLDLIRCVTGRNIVKVTAQTFNPPWSWYKHHAGLKMLLELEGGVPFSYSGDWSAKGRFNSWNGDWRLQCADGSIHMENDKITLARCDKWNKNLTTEPVEVAVVERREQADLLQHFANAIRSGKPGETSGADNLHSFAAVIAGVLSAKEGRAVDVTALIK